MGEEVAAFFPVENGVITIGDLWDMRTSKRVGFNLFGGKLTREEGKRYLDIQDGGEGEAEFEWIQNSSLDTQEFALGATITCELLGGLLDVGGGFDFELGFSRSSNSERLKMVMKSQKHKILLRKGAKEVVDDHLKEILDRGGQPELLLESATHVVTGISLGGVNTSTLDITQTKSGDKYKLGFNIFKEVNLFLLSGKFEASASIGEEIEVSNYDCTVRVNSIPPVKAPTGIRDFVGELEGQNPIPGSDKVSKEFKANLNNEKDHFAYWHDEGKTLVGIPIAFTLEPLADYLPDKEDPPASETLETARNELSPSPAIERLSQAFLIIRDLIDDNYLKRKVLAIQKRAYKILENNQHEIANDVKKAQEDLILLCEGWKKKGIEDYQKFAETFFNPLLPEADRKAALDSFNNEGEILHTNAENKQNSLKDKITEWADSATIQLLAVRVSQTEEEDDDNPNPETESFEEASPLLYFSNEEELQFWLKSKRFCKIIYYAYTPPTEDEDHDKELLALRQRMYETSHLLGSIFIQPGIAYPFSSEKKDLLTLKTPNEEISFKQGEFEKAKDFLILLATLARYNKIDTEHILPQVTNLYQTYCETQGLHFQLSNTHDLVPLLKTIEKIFNWIKVYHNKEEMKLALKDEEVVDQKLLTIVITQDGVQSSRATLYTMLLLRSQLRSPSKRENGTFRYNVVSGPLMDGPDFVDAPPVFLAWDGSIKATCLDHLDTLILLHFMPQEEEGAEINLKSIEDFLEFREEYNFSLCTMARKEFALRVRREQGKRDDPSLVKESANFFDTSCNTFPSFLDLVTNYLNAAQNDFMKFINSFTQFVRMVLGPIWENEDFTTHWHSGECKFIGLNPQTKDGWEEVKTKLAMFWSSKMEMNDVYGYYDVLSGVHALFQDLTLNVEPDPEPETEPEGLEEEDPEVDLNSPEGQYAQIESTILREFQDLVLINDFLQQIEIIRVITLAEVSYYKTSAAAYLSALAKEVSNLERNDESLRFSGLSLYKRVIAEVASTGKIRTRTYHECIRFYLAYMEASTTRSGYLDPFVLSKVKRDLRYDRYFHVVDHLIEATPENFEKEELVVFQKEITRMTSLTDWWNLIRLIESMGTLEEETASWIWRNDKFRFMIETNVGNKYVLEALIKAFMPNGPPVPRYIPRLVAIQMLRYNLTPEGYPYLFEKEWISKEVMLKSLQVLYMVKDVPLGFQRLLLHNLLREDGLIYNILKDSGVLAELYWNGETERGNQYFLQVWDLESIFFAIEKIMSSTSKRTKVGKNPHQQSHKFQRIGTITTDKKPDIQLRRKHEIMLMNTRDYLLLKQTSQLTTELDKFLYHAKHSRFLQIDAEGANPFLSSNRINILTEIFSSAEPSLWEEILRRLITRHEESFAIPALIRESTGSKFLSLLDQGGLSSLDNKKEGQDFNKVITTIRIGGNYSKGKTLFLNTLTRRDDTFTTYPDGTEMPAELIGFAESFKIKKETSSEKFWPLLQNKEEFFLINLHGNAADMPKEVLKELQRFSSNFLVFIHPYLDTAELERDIVEITEALKPAHTQIFLYIDPNSEQGIPPENILSSENLLDENNLVNLASAFSTALKRRGRKGEAESNSVIQIPTRNENAVLFHKLLLRLTIKGVKSSLILQKVRWDRKPMTPVELKSYFENTPIYNEFLAELSGFLQSDGLSFLQDLASLLFFRPENHFEISAWNNLKFNRTLHSFDQRLKKDLTPFLQKNVEASILTLSDLLLELCRFKEQLPSEPGIIDVLSLLANLWETESILLPIPGNPMETFFVEEWSQRFISLLSSRKIKIVSTIGGEEGSHVTPILLESLFGPDFTSSHSLSSWTLTSWAGCTMRLIHLPKGEEIEAILLIEARPVNQEASKNYKMKAERDRQISTFLLSISNLVLVLDWKKELQGILETSFHALNKLKESANGKVSELIFVGAQTSPSKEEVSAWLQSTLKVLEDISGIEFEDISSFGNKLVQRAIDSLPIYENFFNLMDPPEPEELPSSVMASLSDAILANLARHPAESEDLPTFLPTLGPIWEGIRDIEFHYPDFDELEEAAKYRKSLHEILNIIDSAFRYHSEDLPNSIYYEVRNFIHSWLKKEEDVSLEKWRDMTWKGVETKLQEMFKDCSIEDGESCHECQLMIETLERIMEEWVELPGSHFTKLSFQETVDSYSNYERAHQLSVGQQIMWAFEEKVWQEEEDRYCQDVEDGLSREQEFALKVRVVSSRRRIIRDFKNTYPGQEELLIEGDGEDYSFLRTLPAWADDQTLLSEDHATRLQDRITKFPADMIVECGFNAIYQTGMIRRIEERLEMAVEQWLIEVKEEKRKLLGSFKMAIIKNAVVKLAHILAGQEDTWEKGHNPLLVFLEL